MNVDENLTTTDLNVGDNYVEATPPPKPTPRFDFRDDDKYGYIAAVSEEDRKRGKAAGDVVLFVYRGRDGAKFKIDEVAASGTITANYECAQPCAAIKRYGYDGVSYMGFTPTSLIGAAFSDAFNGFLAPHPLAVRSTTSATSSLPNELASPTPQQIKSADDALNAATNEVESDPRL